jgi:hypothetical protein
MTKVDHVIRESEDKDKNDDSPYVKLNLKFWIYEYSYQYRLISKIVKSSKIDMNSDFEPGDIKSIPKIVESSKTWWNWYLASWDIGMKE